MIRIRDTFINPDYVSMARVNKSKNGEIFTLVVDFAYSKPEGPVFLTFEFDTAAEANEALSSIVGDDIQEESK